MIDPYEIHGEVYIAPDRCVEGLHIYEEGGHVVVSDGSSRWVADREMFEELMLLWDRIDDDTVGLVTSRGSMGLRRARGDGRWTMTSHSTADGKPSWQVTAYAVTWSYVTRKVKEKLASSKEE